MRPPARTVPLTRDDGWATVHEMSWSPGSVSGPARNPCVVALKVRSSRTGPGDGPENTRPGSIPMRTRITPGAASHSRSPPSRTSARVVDGEVVMSRGAPIVVAVPPPGGYRKTTAAGGMPGNRVPRAAAIESPDAGSTALTNHHSVRFSGPSCAALSRGVAVRSSAADAAGASASTAASTAAVRRAAITRSP